MGVKFTFVLDAAYESVLNQLLVDLYQILKDLWGLDSRRFIEILSLTKGSVEVVGDVHMPENETDEYAFLDRVKSVLVSQTSIASYSVLSVKA